MVRALVFAIAVLSTVSVRADSTDRDLARLHFKKGNELYQRGDFASSATEFKSAYELAPLPQFLFNLGQAYRQATTVPNARRLALDYYRRYLAALPSGAGADEAREHVAALEAEIAKEPVVTPPPTVVVPPAAVVAAPVVVKQRTPLVRRWYVWTPVAVVVVGAVAAGVAVGVRPRPWNNVGDVGPGVHALLVHW